MVEWSPEAMCINVNGVVEYVNPASVALFGASSAADLTGRPMLDFVHPDSRPVALERRHAVESGAGAVPLREMKFLKLDGTTIICEAQGLAVMLDGRRAIQIAMRDVTARKQVEAALAQQQERLQQVLAVSSIGLWEWDLASGAVYFSPEWNRNLGYVDAEFTDSFDEGAVRTHPDDLATVQRAIDDFLSGVQATYKVEFRMRHCDDTWHWYLSQADIICGADGRALRLVGTQIDITERRRDEIALRENELRLRLAIRGASLGLWDWDASSGSMVVNDRWMTMLGMEPDGPRPSIDDWHARVHPEDRPKLAQLQADIYSNPRLVDFEAEVRARHDDGGYCWIFDKGQVAERDGDGKPVRIVGTHMDITERKTAELLGASLEAQLRESQKMQAIGTLAGGVAHDFNNIIAAILGNAELARGDATDARVLESLAEIERAGKRGRDLVRQILSFSRRQPIVRRATQLADVVDESVALLRATLPARVSLEVSCAEDVPLVLADPTQMEQVIINLASNAVHAIQHQQGVVRIELSAVDIDADPTDLRPGHHSIRKFVEKWPGRSVCLSVSDNGIGMDAATLARIFEPFFTTKPVNEGTGLGLSVVHGIIESHGGATDVTSEVGKGTRFRAYFPIAVVADANDSAPAIPPAGATLRWEPPAPVSVDASPTATIMYLDDDAALVSLVGRLLRRRGWEVVGFTDQQRALAALAAEPQRFALLVTDYNMPGMSGIDVALKAREIFPALPIAIASGFVDDTLRDKAAFIGVHDLLRKETVVDDFCTTIERLLPT